MDNSCHNSRPTPVLRAIHPFDKPSTLLRPGLRTNGIEGSHVSREKGFTLIELMIVTALIGIVAAIATPQFTQMLPGMRVNTATRQVTSKMLLLRMKAVSENRGYQIILSPGGIENQYQIQLNGSIVETETLPTGIIFGTNATKNTNDQTITCSDDGICLNGNKVSFTTTGTVTSGTIYLIPQEDMPGRNDRMRAISISSAGRIKAWKYRGGGAPWWTSF